MGRQSGRLLLRGRLQDRADETDPEHGAEGEQEGGLKQQQRRTQEKQDTGQGQG